MVYNQSNKRTRVLRGLDAFYEHADIGVWGSGWLEEILELQSTELCKHGI